jgi:hypothetical protein
VVSLLCSILDHMRVHTQCCILGSLVVLAGQTSGYANGVNTAARFLNPRGVAYGTIKGSGVIYVADGNNHVIRKIITASSTGS